MNWQGKYTDEGLTLFCISFEAHNNTSRFFLPTTKRKRQFITIILSILFRREAITQMKYVYFILFVFIHVTVRRGLLISWAILLQEINILKVRNDPFCFLADICHWYNIVLI